MKPASGRAASMGVAPTMAVAFAVAAASFVLPGGLRAQAESSQGLELAAGWFAWGGGNSDGLAGGPRVQGTALLPIPAPIAFGFRAVYGWEGVEDSDNEVSELSLAVVVHRTFGEGDGLRPFAEGVVGWSRLHIGDGGEIPIVEENGITVGPRIGLVVPVGGWQMTLSGEATYNSYGDIRVVQGTPTGVEGDKGWHYGATIGFRVSD